MFEYVRVFFKQSEYVVRESDGRVAITIQAARRYFYDSFYVKIRASVNRDLKPYASSDDFEESIHTVKFWYGRSTATVYIKIKDDNRVEGTEAFKLDILIPRDLYSRGVKFGSPVKAKVFIKDDDKVIATKPPTMNSPRYGVRVSFSHAEYRVKESDGHVIIKVVVSGYRKFPIQLLARSFVPTKYKLPAANSKDFKVGQYKLYFPVSSDVATVKIPIYNDYIVEGTEAFAVDLYISDYYRNRYVGYGNPFLTKVIIDDDDKHPVTKPPPPPTVKPVKSIYVQFSQENYVVDESAGYAVLKVMASGYRDIPISVNVKIFVSSKFQPAAASTNDVKIGVTRLVFHPSDSTQTVRVRIYDDKLVEGTEAFGVQLIVPDHHVSNGVKLGNPSLSTVYIKDDDKPVTPPPTKPPTTQPPRPPAKKMAVRVRFQYGSYKVKESCTLLSVKLVVVGKVTKPFTIGVIPMSHYMPSAQAGKDFETGVQKVTFKPGQTYSSVCIVINDDDIREGTEKFRLVLSIHYSVQKLGVWAAYPYFADIIILDDSDDGMGLPVQLPPTDDQRATMCRCRPRPTMPTTIPTTPPTTMATTPPTTRATTPPTTLPPSTPPPPPQIMVSFKTVSYSTIESVGSIVFSVQSSEAFSDEFSVEFCTRNSNPVSAEDGGVDYTELTQLVTFPPDETCVLVTVAVEDDAIHEVDESFIGALKLTNSTPVHVSIGTPSTAVGVIIDNDDIVVRFLNDAGSALESDGSISFTVIALVSSQVPFTVQVCTRESDPQSAEADVDYISLVQNLTFNPGDTSRTFTVDIVNDTIAESNETFEVHLKPIPNSPFDVTILEPSIATGTIVDDELPTVRFLTDSSSAVESDGSISFTIIPSVPSDRPFTVQVCTREIVPLSAEANVDYVTAVQDITFNSGDVSRVFTVNIINDTIAESEESFEVFLKLIPGSSGVAIGEPSVATGTIIDDEILTVQFLQNASSAVESDGSISFTVISLVVSDSPFTVQVCTRDTVPLSAEADVDYERLVQNITFDSGEVSNFFDVNIINDTIAESEESFEVFLKLVPGSLGVTIGEPSVATGNILDDEIPTVRLLSNVSSARESDGFVRFTLVSSFPSDDPFTVQVFTMERNRTTATSGVDFEPVILNVTFEAGETLKILNVTIIPDNIVEDDERFYVQMIGFEDQPNTISEPDGAWATIFDDDMTVRYEEIVVRGDESSGELIFTLVTSEPAMESFTVQVCTTELNDTGGGPASEGFATADVDYDSDVIDVVFNVGDSRATIAINITDDNIDEGNEAFGLVLKRTVGTPPTVQITGLTTAFGIIDDNDEPGVRFQSSSSTAPEADGVIQFAVELTVPSDTVITVQVCTEETTPVSAQGNDVDFTNVVQNVTFEIGETVQIVSVPITRDSIIETAEEFNLVLKRVPGDSTNTTILEPSVSVGIITDTTPGTVQFVQAIQGPAQTENISPMRFELVLSRSVSRPFNVEVCTRSGSATGEGIDYSTVSRNVTFFAGNTSQFFDVPLIDDNVLEPTEQFTVVIKAIHLIGEQPIPPVVIGGNTVATGTILDNDGFTVMFNDSGYNGSESDGVIPVTVVATGVSSVPYTVTITPSELVPVSAREVFDYSNDTIVVTFNPGETEKTVLVIINPDCIREGSEFFNLALSLDPAATTLGITLGDPSVATAEIEDTDIIFISFSQPMYIGKEADGMIIITVEADGFSIWPYSVEVNPIELLPVGGPGNAEGNGTDFVSDTLIALFNPGDTQVNVSLPIIFDEIFEPIESLNLTLTVPDEFSNLNGRLLIKPGLNSFAEGKLNESSVLVNFTEPRYTADVNATSVIVNVEAHGFFDVAFLVVVVPDAENIPEGDLFFDPDIKDVLFPTGVNLAIVPITLFPEVVMDTDLEFIVRLIVPDTARSQGVLLGEPNVSTVTVPATRP